MVVCGMRAANERREQVTRPRNSYNGINEARRASLPAALRQRQTKCGTRAAKHSHRKIAMKKPSIKAATAALVPAPQITMETLRALSVDDLIAQLKTAAVRQSSQHIALGKMLVVLDDQRDEETDKTLKGFVRKMVGEEIEPASYKVAKAFSIVGEGHGTILETQFDACALNWLLTVSAIVGFLEKHDAETGARVREAVAMLLRSPNEKTGAALKAIKDSVKPESEGAGEGEGDGVVLDLTLPDFLSADHIKALHAALEACQCQDTLATMWKGFRALHSIAVIRAREIRAAAAPVAA